MQKKLLTKFNMIKTLKKIGIEGTTSIPHQKLFEPINEFSKVAGYKINTRKSVVFLYTNHDHSVKETEKTILFIIASKE